MKRKKTRAVDLPWTPFVVGTLPPEVVEARPGIRCFLNSRYQVLIEAIGVGSPTAGGGGEIPGWWVSIKTRDNRADHDWRDFQRIKNELIGPHAEGVELYPDEDRVVDTSNQYHLWVFENFRFPFGYPDRLVMNEPKVSMPTGTAIQRPREDDQ